MAWQEAPSQVPIFIDLGLRRQIIAHATFLFRKMKIDMRLSVVSADNLDKRTRYREEEVWTCRYLLFGESGKFHPFCIISNSSNVAARQSRAANWAASALSLAPYRKLSPESRASPSVQRNTV
ncbi:unnamed protein product, partial [Iphiclides podalirius]